MTIEEFVGVMFAVIVVVTFSWAWWRVTAKRWPLRVHLAMNLGGFALGLATLWLY